MDEDSFRMIANPYRLLKDPRVSNDSNDSKGHSKLSFKESLQKLVDDEYTDIYINRALHNQIHDSIVTVMNNHVIHKLVEDEVDCIIESCLHDALSEI